jgi:serine/threonine-protein kinase
VVHLGASWAVLEAVALFSERYGLPSWLFNLALAALLVGLPVVVVASLATEEVYGDAVPAEARDAAAAEDRRLRRLTWRSAGLALLGAAALWGVIAAGWIIIAGKPGAADYLAGRAKLVVLPFENLGDPADEYFADGVTEEITSRLAQVSGVAIVGRTTAKDYKGTDKTIQEIGAELGADYVLEGSVRWEKTPEGVSRVRVTPQLVRVADDTHLWAERYDADYADIFEIQTRVGENVLRALNVALHDRERERLRVRPTDNPQAYDYYLRSLELNIAGVEGMYLKVEYLEKALVLDPNFAAAWAQLAIMHAALYHTGWDRSDDRVRSAKTAADRAIELDPELPVGHYALGIYYYWCHRDYDRALDELAIARRFDSSSIFALYWTGVIQKRQGMWEESVRSLEAAYSLDPQGSPASRDLAAVLYQMREYQRAESYADFYLDLDPDDKFILGLRALGYLRSDGDVERALAALRLRRERTGAAHPHFQEFSGRALERIVYREYGRVIEDLALTTYWPADDSAEYYLMKATYFERLGDDERTLAYYDSARWISELWMPEWSHEAYVHETLALAFAGLGRKGEAIQEAQQAMQMYPVSLDAVTGPEYVANLAQVYVMTGEHDAAIDQLEYLLSIPSDASVALLRLDPLWDPLRDHPRFQALLRTDSGSGA